MTDTTPSPTARGTSRPSSSTPPPLNFGEGVAAALWGFGEAIFFFIAPDVLISMIAAQRRLRAALLAAFIVFLAALVGGVLMYSWGAGTKLKIIFGFMDVIPAISREMLQQALHDLQSRGPWAVLNGMFTGTPFKVYAALAPHAGISLFAFLLVSLSVRIIRFVLVALLSHGVAIVLKRIVPGLHPLWAWAGFWLIFYATWFTFMPG